MESSEEGEDEMSDNGEGQITTYTPSGVEKHSQRKKKKCANITAEQRAKQKNYSKNFHAKKGVLYCNSCGKHADHTRVSSMKKHLTTAVHRASLQKPHSQVQPSITTAIKIQNKAKLEKVSTIRQFLKALISSNIPLNVVNNTFMREFLRVKVEGGGDIPRRQALVPYIKDLYKIEKENLKKLFANKSLIVSFDETCDSEGRYVCAVLFTDTYPDNCSRLTSYTAEVHFLDHSPDHKTVAGLVINTLNAYELQASYGNVSAFCSDNVSYNLRAFDHCLQTLLVNAKHLSCLAHILNLVCEAYLEEFPLLIKWVQMFATYFSHSGARKFRYLAYLENKGASRISAPSPCSTRWGTTFRAIEYYNSRINFVTEFLQKEEKIIKEPNATARKLFAIAKDENHIAKIRSQTKFVTHRHLPFLKALDIFQSNLGLGCLLYEQIERIQIELSFQKLLGGESLDEIFNTEDAAYLANLSNTDKVEFLAQISRAAEKAEAKLLKWLDNQEGEHPGSWGTRF